MAHKKDPLPTCALKIFHKNKKQTKTTPKKTKYDPKAKKYFDFFSGAFVWSDELAPFSDHKVVEIYSCVLFTLRYLAMHRGSLIKGEADTDYRALWEEAKKEIPDWPGFREEKCSQAHKQDLLDWGRELGEMEESIAERKQKTTEMK